MNSLILITFAELRRLFLGRQGWVALFAFGLIWFVLMRFVIFNAATYVVDPDSARLIGGLTGNAG